MTIAVTTPTGHIGSRVVRLLVQAGQRPRVLVRDPQRLDPAIRDLVDVAQGDLGDADFVRRATEGADRLFWAVPEQVMAPDPVTAMARLGEHAAAAITANGIARTVLISSVGAERKHGVGLIDGLARNEEALTATGADVLILRCGYFFTNLLGSLDQIRAGSLSTTMPADAPMPWVDPRDIGDVAAARLLAAGWSGERIQAVHGPADLSWSDAVSTVAAAVGRELSLHVLTDDQLRQILSGTGMPGSAVEGIVGMTTGLRDGYTPEQPRSALSTTPTTLAAWAYEHLRPAL